MFNLSRRRSPPASDAGADDPGDNAQFSLFNIPRRSRLTVISAGGLTQDGMLFIPDRYVHQRLSKTTINDTARHPARNLKITADGNSLSREQSPGNLPDELHILYPAVHAPCPVIEGEHTIYVRRGRDHSLPAGQGGEMRGECICTSQMPRENRDDEPACLIDDHHGRVRCLPHDMRRDLSHSNAGSTDKNQRIALTEMFRGPVGRTHICVGSCIEDIFFIVISRLAPHRQMASPAPDKGCLFAVRKQLLRNFQSQSLAPVREGCQRNLHLFFISIL